MITRARRQDSNNIFMNSTPTDYQFVSPSFRSSSTRYEAELSQTRKAETNRRLAAERHAQVLQEVVAMEVKMDISTRWQPADAQYMETLKYMSERDYHRALDNLQRLVVQRLFELNRLNLAGTGTSLICLESAATDFTLCRLSHAHSHFQVSTNSVQSHSKCSEGIQCCCTCNGSSSPNS